MTPEKLQWKITHARNRAEYWHAEFFRLLGKVDPDLVETPCSIDALFKGATSPVTHTPQSEPEATTPSVLAEIAKASPVWKHGLYTAVAKHMGLSSAHVRNVAMGLRVSSPVMKALEVEATRRQRSLERAA